MISGLNCGAFAAIISSVIVACPRLHADGHATQARSLTHGAGPLSIVRHSSHLGNCPPCARREGGTEMDAKQKPYADLQTKITVRGLNFYYGDTHALKAITLPFYANRVTALIGPSGCGKSTLLRVMNRMYDLYPGHRAEGEVLLDGNNILSSHIDLNLLRSRVGMVFQKATPFPMSIYDNIAFGIRAIRKARQA